jgi:prepilin-type N-terminal cleavage/methylation domain-containing protein
MRTWATSRRAELRAAGYTLLELLVVLAVMGMVAAIAAPPIARQVEAWRAETAFRDASRQMERLPAAARRAGRGLVLDGPEHWPTALGPWPEGLTVSEPIHVEPNGYCRGGRITVSVLGRTREARVAAPFCRVETEGGAP